MLSCSLIFIVFLSWILFECSAESATGCFNIKYDNFGQYSWQRETRVTLNITCSVGIINLKTLVYSIPKTAACPEQCSKDNFTCDCCGKLPNDELCRWGTPFLRREKASCNGKKLCVFEARVIDMSQYCPGIRCAFCDPLSKIHRCYSRQMDLKYDCLPDNAGWWLKCSMISVNLQSLINSS